jgi:proteasome lid subunit RPN8/RPN11
MNPFTLPASLEAEMLEHAGHGHPHEVMGFLVGASERCNEPYRAVRMDNIANDPAWYCEPPAEQVEAMFADLDDRKEDHHGVYHSHPVSPSATPSDRDIANCEDLDTVHLIVAPNATPAVRAWRISEHENGRRSAVEVPIVRTSSADQVITMQAHLVVDNVVAISYQSQTGDIRELTRVRVTRLQTDSVVITYERRQVTIGLDRIRSVQLIEEATLGARRRAFAAKLLRQAAELIDEHRIGDGRSAIEAACHALPGLRPRMGE